MSASIETLLKRADIFKRASSFQLDLLLADFLTKKVAWEVSSKPGTDLETDCPEYRAAQEAVERLIFFPCNSFAVVIQKALIIRDHGWLSEEVEQNLDQFLTSLTGGEVD